MLVNIDQDNTFFLVMICIFIFLITIHLFIKKIRLLIYIISKSCVIGLTVVIESAFKSNFRIVIPIE